MDGWRGGGVDGWSVSLTTLTARMSTFLEECKSFSKRCFFFVCVCFSFFFFSFFLGGVTVFSNMLC